MTRFLFDMDGTVTACETLPMIAARYGVLDEVDELTRMAVLGEVPFDESFVKRVQVLGRFPADEVSRLVAQVPLHALVGRFIATHRERCSIVTSNLDCWCWSLMEKLGCTAHCSRAVLLDGRVHGVASILRKEDVVDAYIRAGETVVFIGDGHNDLEAMRHAHIAIAAGLVSGSPAPSLIPIAHHVFHDESALCQYLEILASGRM